MIPAYDETYLPDAMANLAGAFDYALNDCGLPVGLFMDFFATSEAAALFGRGTPKYVCGMSGEELVAEIMRQTGWARILDMPPAALRAGSTPEYWAGWVLAYCQWARGVRFSDILDVLSLDDIVRLHPGRLHYRAMSARRWWADHALRRRGGVLTRYGCRIRLVQWNAARVKAPIGVRACGRR